jgi:hypothetical protein
LVVGGGGDPFGTSCAVTPSKSIMNVLGVTMDALHEVIGPDAASDMGHHPDALKRAEQIGRELVEAARHSS